MSPTFTNGWARGLREQKNSKPETGETVLTITKALTKATIIVLLETAKKVAGHDTKCFFGAWRRTCSPPPPL